MDKQSTQVSGKKNKKLSNSMGIIIPTALRRELESIAIEEDRTLSSVIRRLLVEALEARKLAA